MEASSRRRWPFAATAAVVCAAIWASLSPGSRSARAQAGASHAGTHFDRVLIIVLENQNFDSARKDPYLERLAQEGVDFTNFHAIGHPSYPNYLAMVAGSPFGAQSDRQIDFPDDEEHATIANFLDWRGYAENYPELPTPFLGDRGKYARKHVPFLSFTKIQKYGADRMESVNTQDPHNRFVTDIQKFRSDPRKVSFAPVHVLLSESGRRRARSLSRARNGFEKSVPVAQQLPRELVPAGRKNEGDPGGRDL